MSDRFLDEFEKESGVQRDVQEANIAVHPPYTAVQLAEWCGVGDATIRNRWFGWLLKVAPEVLLAHGDD